jgi:hypothetical protein
MTHFFTDDDDDKDNTNNGEEAIVEAGEYDLGDDVGERIGKDDSSDNLPI